MNRTALLLAALTFSLVLSAAARAQEDVDCSDPQNTVEMRYCASQDFDAADQQLNSLYKQLTRRLEPEPLAILKSSQRAWVAFRDSECEFQAYWTKGGSISPQLEIQCMAALTQARVKQLEAYVNCEEGDLTCPPAE